MTGAGQHSGVQAAPQVADAAAAGAAGGLSSRQQHITDRKDIAIGIQVRSRAQADVVGGSHQALQGGCARHGGGDVGVGALQCGGSGGRTGLRVACRDHASAVHAQVPADLELNLAAGTQLTEGRQRGVADQLALNAQVTSGQHQRILSGRNASGEQSIALGHDVDVTSRDAVGVERAAALRGPVHRQAFGDGLGAVFGRGHILVECDLGNRRHLGFDLIGAELDLVGIDVGDRAGPVVVERGPAVADAGALADPVEPVNVESLVDVVGRGGTRPGVVVLGGRRTEAAHSVLVVDAGRVGDKGRRGHIVPAAPVVGGVGTLPGPGGRVGDDAR